MTSDLLEGARAISVDQYIHERARSASSNCSSRRSSRGSFSDLQQAMGEEAEAPLVAGHVGGLTVPRPLTSFQRSSFSIGHILNDMCASLWFTYLLVYLETTLHLSPTNAGIVMLSGQIADGMATPCMGLLSDSLHGKFYRIPIINITCCSRTLIHFLSTVVVFICFSGVWIVTPDGTTSVFYYSLAAALFNIGWAGVQVTHLALIPDIASSDEERVKLTGFRYSATIGSNLTIYVAYLLLLTYLDPLGDDSREKWRILGLITLAVGMTTSFVFWCGMSQIAVANCGDNAVSREDRGDKSEGEKSMYDKSAFVDDASADVEGGGSDKMNDDDLRAALLPPGQYESINELLKNSENEDTNANEGGMTPMAYLRLPRFYLTSVVYMCTRLLINIIMVYIAFYLLRTLDATTSSIAVIPCVMYVSGFIGTLTLGSRVNMFFGRRGAYVVSSIVIILGCLLGYAIENDDLGGDVTLPVKLPKTMVVPLAIIFGVGTSLLMVTGVSFVNDLVATNLSSSAFVYGCMSFTDKLGTGAVVILVQNHRTTVCPEACDDCPDDGGDDGQCGDFVRQVLCGVPVAACLVAICVLPLLGEAKKKGQKA
jgi:Na+/melibiose symporter-like transporter